MSDVTIYCVYVEKGSVKATMEIHTGLLKGVVVEKMSTTIYDAVKLCVLSANSMADEIRKIGTSTTN